MVVEYTRNLSHNYMLIREDTAILSDTYEMRILMSNRIPGLLPMEVEQFNDSTVYRYEITSCQPFSAFCSSGRLTVEALRTLYLRLMDSLMAFEDYLLDSSHLMLLPEYLFLKWEEAELRMPYVPFYQQEIRRSLLTLTEAVLMQISHTQQDSIVLACRILHELQDKDMQLMRLRTFLEEQQWESYSRPAAQPLPVQPEGPVSPVPAPAEMDEEEPLWTPGRMAMREEPVQTPGRMAMQEEPLWMSGRMAMQEETPGERWEEQRQAGSRQTDLSSNKEALRRTLLAAIPAALLFVVLRTQEYLVLTTEEAAGFAILVGVILVLVIKLIQVLRENRSRKEETPQTAVSGSERSYPEEKGWGREDLRGDASSRDGAGMSDPDAALLVPVDRSGRLAPIRIRGRELLVGRQKPLVDAVIEVESISRIHARIFRKNGMYYVSDMGSKNGTSVDGHVVIGREEVPLTEGAHVCFAECEYVYQTAEPKSY